MQITELTEVANWYAMEMAYASKSTGNQGLRNVVDSCEDFTNLQNDIIQGDDEVTRVAIKYIKDYGTSVFNMRTNDRKEWYPTFQTERMYAFQGNLHKLCMDKISYFRKQDNGYLIGQLDEYKTRFGQALEEIRQKRIDKIHQEVIQKANQPVHKQERPRTPPKSGGHCAIC